MNPARHVARLAAAAALTLGLTATLEAQTTSKTPAKRTAATERTVATAAPQPVIYTTAAEGNQARYRVRERLLGKELDNDAIGVTGGVSGALTLDANGKIVPGDSKFVVDMTPLKSDQDRRDGMVQRRILETATYPTTTLQLTEVRGLASPLPKSGATTFQLVGDLTVKGVTKPTIWNVTANVDGERLTGMAATAFTFETFGIAKPRVPMVLSLADTIKLEYDFTLLRKPGR